jgi:hypothetical protein
MPRKERRRGPVAYVTGPLLFAAAVLALGGASRPIEARAIDTIELRPAAERRARLVRTFDGEPVRQPVEAPSRDAQTARAPHRSEPLLTATLLMLALSAAAYLASGAGLRLSRIAGRIR